MKTLLVISVFYFNYVTSLEKYAVKTYPKKVKPFGAGKILINPAKYMYKPSTPDPSKTLSDKIIKYTVFQVIGNSKANRGVPDSPYFSLDQVNDHKPRVKKILPDYVWSSLSRVKRSAPEAPASEAPKTESEAPKAESEVTIAATEAPIAASEAPIAASEAPIAASEAPKAASEAPKAESEAPKTESEAPKAESEAPKAESIAPKAENIARTAESIAPKAESIVPKVENKAPKVENQAPKVKSTPEPKIKSKKETSTTNKPPEKKKVQTTSQKPKAKKQDIVPRAHDKKSSIDPKKKNLTTTKRVEKLRAKLKIITTKRVEKLRTKLKALSTVASKISNKTVTKLNKVDLKRVTRAAKKKNPIRKGNNTAVFRSRSSKTNGTRSKKKIKRKSKSKNGKEKKPKSGRRRKSKSKSKNKKSKKHSSKRSKSKKSARKGKKRTHRDVNSTDIKILKETRRLTGAREALIEEYPYVVSIQKDEEHWCSGALINPRIVITTANCLWKADRISRMEVRCGSSYTDQGGQVAEIAQVMKHPRWGLRNTPDNDVALILLDRNIKFSHSVHAVDLPNRVMYPAFDDAWVTSFGSERRDGIFEAHETNLQVYHTHLMSNETCNNITTRFGVTVTENFICFSQAGKTSPCTRDTGAPAVSDGVLWGLASWSIRKLCGTERFPSMFSYLASHSNMDFITEATRVLMSEKRVYPFLDRSFAPKLKSFPTSQTPFVH